MTDAYLWAPTRGTTPFDSPIPSKATRVENSLTTKPCPRVGDETINPSNGQLLECRMQMMWIDPGPFWFVKDGI